MVSMTAYVPCFNNRDTIRAAVIGVLGQTVAPDEVLVVDDGSTDDSLEQLRDLPLRVLRHAANLGRGAMRARAMREAAHELVLCCDATNVLEPAFAEKALRWFTDERVAAVSGRYTQPPARDVAERWRGRHLFKLGRMSEVQHGGSLTTGGALIRASAVRAVGGFNACLRHSEDADLSVRLLAHGFDIIHDPGLDVAAMASNTLPEVLERYWRWYAGTADETCWRGYWKNIGYSIKGMAAADLRDGDPLSVPVSIITPHYQFWRSRVRRLHGRAAR